MCRPSQTIHLTLCSAQTNHSWNLPTNNPHTPPPPQHTPRNNHARPPPPPLPPPTPVKKERTETFLFQGKMRVCCLPYKWQPFPRRIRQKRLVAISDQQLIVNHHEHNRRMKGSACLCGVCVCGCVCVLCDVCVVGAFCMCYRVSVVCLHW